jgi:hypothetical protein
LTPDRVLVEIDLFAFSVDIEVFDPVFGCSPVPILNGKPVWPSDEWRG